MYKSLKFFCAAMLAVLIAVSPVAGFAKENNGNGKGKGKDNSAVKIEKSMKAAKTEGSKKNELSKSKAEDSNERNDDDSDDDSDEDSSPSSGSNSPFRKCVKAYGHLIAPGWIKKNGLPTVDLSNCWLPFGIAKKFQGPNASTTPDVTAPVISAITSVPAMHQTEVRWNTNESSNSTVFWDTDPVIDTTDSASNRIVKNELVRNHRIVIRNLAADTTYYFVVKSRDAAGNSAQSDVRSFETLATSTDVTAPVISNVVTIIGTSTIQVGWKTNENATDHIYYSTVLPVTPGASTTGHVSNAIATQNHAMTISGLNPNTTYYLVIASTDMSGNMTTSATFSAHTNSVSVPADTDAPVITNITINPGASTTTVAWTTNELSTSRVFYSTTTPLNIGASTTASVLSGSLVTSHSIVLSGLATSTQYYFKIQSIDGSGNATTSNELTASTTSGM